MPLNVGDTARIPIRIYVDDPDDGPVATDPTALSIDVTDPDGVVATYAYPCAQLVKVVNAAEDAGFFEALIDCTAAGGWTWRLVSPGPVAKGAERGEFDVSD